MRLSSHRLRLFATLLALSLLLPAVAPAMGAGEAMAGSDPAAFTVDDLLDVVNVSAAGLSDDGRWLAAVSGSLRDRIGIDNYRFGDPTYIAPSLVDVWIIDTETAKSQKLFPEKRQVRGLKWSPDGRKLALFVLKGDRYEPVVWDRAAGKFLDVAVPASKYAAENSEIEWMADSSKLMFALRDLEWRRKAGESFRQQTRGPVVVLSSKEPFLSWDDLRRMSSLRSIATFDLKTKKTGEFLPETKLSSFEASEDGSFVTYYEDKSTKTDYDVIFGVDNQVQVLSTGGGQPRTVLKSTKGINLIWSADRRSYAFSKEGNLFFGSIDDKEPRQITGKKSEEGEKKEAGPDKVSDKPGGDSAEADRQKREKERFSAVRLSPKGESLIASNKEGFWLVDTATGGKELFLKMPEEDKEAPRYQVVDWSPAGDAIYLSYSSRTKWERGLFRYNARTKQVEELMKGSRNNSGYRVSRDGRTIIFSSAEGNRPADLYAADSNMKNVRRLTDANPQLKAKRLSRTELITYLDADGNKTAGVLYYPSDYEPGKKYPTVFNVYEQFFDDNFNGTINVLTSNGYAVMQPSVTLEQGYPGEAWVKGVTSAANKLIDMGVADPERLGVQGTSYGGYATNLLITQTNRFKAAINISGKVNMVSFYTDSPRLGVRNIHAPEKSQDRIGATLWQQPQKYIQHSAIMFADRIKTPLLLITGDQDHNVPARQAMEMYYALRRLGKEVEWVNYMNGGHGMPTSSVEEVKDYHRRIIAWYDARLKGDPKKKSEERKPDTPAQN
ncbi:MAG TPA: prolyl oligopeptidase family serine peptidase [Blastocatellia bacterium]|nr:prolyl oligopeptidase family serine peptidase [Blastocatellia bacterium]